MPLNHCSDRAHSDKANQAKVKAGMDESARLLEATGSCKFDLDTWWLPPQDEVENNGDETMRDTGSMADDTVSDTWKTPSEEMEEGTSSGHDGARLPAIGDFIFFIAETLHSWQPRRLAAERQLRVMKLKCTGGRLRETLSAIMLVSSLLQTTVSMHSRLTT